MAKDWFKMDNSKAFRLELDYDNRHYSGIILPSEEMDGKGFPVYFRVEIGDRLYAYICCGETGWHNRDSQKGYDGLIDAIGQYIHDWYE